MAKEEHGLLVGMESSEVETIGGWAEDGIDKPPLPFVVDTVLKGKLDRVLWLAPMWPPPWDDFLLAFGAREIIGGEFVLPFSVGPGEIPRAVDYGQFGLPF